jgi:polar amino acid transport system substrate-binding protein
VSRRSLFALPITAILLAACAAPSSSTVTVPSGSASLNCSPAALSLVTPGTLTISTSKPAYPPYVLDDKPTSGKGFESAVAYAVASKLGFTSSQVAWTYVTFEQTYAPGAKTYDFGLQQVSITPDRVKSIAFSTPYYTANQAVVALTKNTTAVNATSITALKKLKLGVQVGTTSLTYITNVIAPTQQPYVFNDTEGAKRALNNGTIDALVVDLPTAFYITGAELTGAQVVGQFKGQDANSGDKWGLVMNKGSALVPCVDQALAELKSSGQLQQIQDQWLSTAANAPYITP